MAEHMEIVVEGHLDRVPAVADILTKCVAANAKERRDCGDMFFDGLHITYTYANKEVRRRGRKRKGEE